MLVFREKADIKIEYPLDSIVNKESTLFFDIETTGFSRQYCKIYLIGVLYFIGDQPMYTQWFAENFNDEANVLMAFHKFIKNYDTIIHFNGNSFDIPFVKERGAKYKLDFNFDSFNSIDIYKPLTKLKHILKMENQKQKTFEEMLGIKRTDPFTGGELVEVYNEYVRRKDEKLIFPLLLHNKEDVWNMGHLLKLLAITDMFNGNFKITDYNFDKFRGIDQKVNYELIINLSLDNSLPFSISYGNPHVYLRAQGNIATISVKSIHGELKYFFENYREYYYLPVEDRAVHESLASFVDPKFRKRATAASCYEKIYNDFIPSFGYDLSKKYFKTEYKDKNTYILNSEINDDNIHIYTLKIFNKIKEAQ